ncbi:GNAT family N-acetyltransferase [Paenibacillus glycanilyticus]|uniref:N-acetyltransferase n=1 Tax=Paenibacillus glycanilyticus TaxID=126569 RepID=A0ABQ6GFT2_9BACL|nr:GNAT family N-acetyltransferase [Paenibacillus glycanilyticus]GLX69345.1 N-acetyltransferase [Paenibacillus glycanilyticus]
MANVNNIQVLASTTNEDKEWLRQLWIKEMGDDYVVSKGQQHRVQHAEGVIAWLDGHRAGAATYRISGQECELTSLHATMRGAGIGSKLIEAVEQIVSQLGVQRLWLITTNDNMNAMRFYQKQGYRLKAVYPGAVDEARQQLKPSIPLIGNDNIPIRDEIEVEKFL